MSTTFDTTKYSYLIYLFLNRLTPNDSYMGRNAPLTSNRCILYIYSTNIGTEYFKHALYIPFFPLQNAVCFIMLTCLVPVLFTFCIQNVLKLKKNNSGAKGLSMSYVSRILFPCHKKTQNPSEGKLKHSPMVICTNVRHWKKGR